MSALPYSADDTPQSVLERAWPQAAADAWRQAQNTPQENRVDGWRETVYAPARRQMEAGLARMLEFLRDAGQLQPLAHFGHREVWWSKAWDTWVSQGGPMPEVLSRLMSRPLAMFSGLDLLDEQRTSPDVFHQTMIRRIVQGGFDWFDFEQFECRLTGDAVGMRLNPGQWQPILGRVPAAHEPDLHDYTQDAEPAGIDHTVLPVPSGTVWFTTSSEEPLRTIYETITERAIDQRAPSFNTLAGKRVLQQFAAELGMGYVTVSSDSSVSVVAQGEALLLARYDEDAGLEAGQTHQGDVDESEALFFDPAVLRDFLATTQTLEHAQAQVDRLKEETDSLVVMAVPSGVLHLYTSSDPEVFNATFLCDTVPRLGLDSVYTVASVEPLTLKSIPTPSRRRRP